MNTTHNNNHRNGTAHPHSRRRTHGQPRLVDYLHRRDDYECALLGALGFSSRYIQSKTGLRNGQITYRLRKAQISRMDFRNGQSVYAKLVLRNMRSVAEPKLIKELYQLTPPVPGESAGLPTVAA
jgi:hypothetical protein